jgi:hypothetical protein
VCWNVHFFQRGCSGEEGGDNRAEVAAVIAQLAPDVILLQEPGPPTRGAPGDPFAPRQRPLGSSPDRERVIGNAPALVPGPLARHAKTCGCSQRSHPQAGAVLPRRLAGGRRGAGRRGVLEPLTRTAH